MGRLLGLLVHYTCGQLPRVHYKKSRGPWRFFVTKDYIILPVHARNLILYIRVRMIMWPCSNASSWQRGGYNQTSILLRTWTRWIPPWFLLEGFCWVGFIYFLLNTWYTMCLLWCYYILCVWLYVNTVLSVDQCESELCFLYHILRCCQISLFAVGYKSAENRVLGATLFAHDQT